MTLNSGHSTVDRAKQGAVKILIVSGGGQEGIASKDNISTLIANQKSNGLKSRLNKLSEELTLKGIDYQVEFVNESPRLLDVVSKIKAGKYDLVLLSDDIKLSAWEIIRQCGESKSDNKPPRFYLEGNVENIVDNVIKCSNFSGAVGINKDGKPLLRGAYKQACRSLGHPLDNRVDTKFGIASVTKLLTAVAIAKLVEEQKLKYSDPIANYLPDDFPNKAFFIEKNITIRELLTHTSGLRQSQGELFFKEKMLDFKSLKDFSPMLAGNDIYKAANRTQFEYSNLNYLLLGFAIERASGNDYYKYIDENVLPKENHGLPMRGSNQSFALNYRPTLELIESPDWLQQMASEENATIKNAASNANNCLKRIKDITNSLTELYQNDIAKVDNPESLALLKSKFKTELEHAFKDIDDIRNEIQRLLLTLDKELAREGIAPTEKDKITQLKKLFSDSSHMLDEQSFTGVPIYLYSFVNDLTIANPAGYWRSTVDDLLLFQEDLWSGKIIKDPSTIINDKILLPQDGPFEAYSYGVCTWGADGITQSIGHDGAGLGTISSARRYPHVGMNVVTLANDEDQDAFVLRDLIGQYLVASCSPESNVQYFDPRINPNALELFVQDASKKEVGVEASTQTKSAARALINQYQSYVDQNRIENERKQKFVQMEEKNYTHLTQVQSKQKKPE